jgi:hypothetical protein
MSLLDELLLIATNNNERIYFSKFTCGLILNKAGPSWNKHHYRTSLGDRQQDALTFSFGMFLVFIKSATTPFLLYSVWFWMLSLITIIYLYLIISLFTGNE